MIRLTPPRPPAVPRALAVATAMAAAALLAGCGGGSGSQFAPACPQLSLLGDAADLTRFSPAGRDITDMVIDARIAAVPASCSSASRGTVKGTLHVVAQLTRGPAAQGRSATVPYFVAVTDGDNILDEQDFSLAATFPPNVDTITANGQEVTLNIPVAPDRSAAAYKIYVGFRLNADELSYNRSRGPR